jgi:hypothetical protein
MVTPTPTEIFLGLVNFIILICTLVVFISLWLVDTNASYEEEPNKTRVRDAVNSSKVIGWILLVIIILTILFAIKTAYF